MSPASASPTAHVSNLNEIARGWPEQHLPQRWRRVPPGRRRGWGMIVLITPGGAVSQAADEIAFPTAWRRRPTTRRWSSLSPSAASSPRTTASRTAGCPTARVAEVFSDGICLHTESGVWSPGLDRRQARLPARPGGGEVLRWTETDHACVGCMLGGQDGRRCHAGHRLEHGQRLRGELAAADHRGLAPANYTPPPRGCPVPAGPRA